MHWGESYTIWLEIHNILMWIVQKNFGDAIIIVKQESIIERPKSLVEIAADVIRRGIIRWELILGQPLTEAGLAKKRGISNTQVR